jgi:hypothetical protein
LRFSVINLTDKMALDNFLSTFSGTHFGERIQFPFYRLHLIEKNVLDS